MRCTRFVLTPQKKTDEMSDDTRQLLLMFDIDEAITRHHADLSTVITVADRLLVSAFAQISEQPVSQAQRLALLDKTLAMIRRHVVELPTGGKQMEN